MDATRRQFLSRCAASGVTLAAAATGQDRRPKRRFRFALKYGMVQEGSSLLGRFRLLRELGYDGVELDSPSDLDLDEVLAAREATGLEIPGVVDSLHWQKPFSHPDASVRAEGRRALETALRECARLGGTSVLLVPAVVNKDVSYDQAWRRSTAEIRRVLPLAAEVGVQIAIENVWNQFLLSPLEAARYVDQFDSPWIGWHFDIGNVVNFGWPEQWIRILGKRILKLDVKGFSRSKRNEEGLWKGFQVEIGDGDCGWPEVRNALADLGYRGWASAEVRGGGRERLADILRRMRQVFGVQPT